MRCENDLLSYVSDCMTPNMVRVCTIWKLDACWIHEGCDNLPNGVPNISFRTGSFGALPGWYCNDFRPTIPFVTTLDNCAIHLYCAFSPLGIPTGNWPYFNTDAQTWFCNDIQPPPPDPPQIIDHCFIHPGCSPPLEVIFVNGAWVCSDDKFSTTYGDSWYVG